MSTKSKVSIQTTLFVQDENAKTGHSPMNIPPSHFNLDELVKLALTDDSAKGLVEEEDGVTTNIPPLSVLRKHVLPYMELYLSNVENGTSLSVHLRGESYVCRIKLVNGTHCKNQPGNSMQRVVWNHSLLTEGGRLASMMIGTKRGVTHSKRNK